MITKNLLPQVISVIMMRVALSIPLAIGQEVFLTYIGLGLPISIPSLGNLINEGRIVMMSPSLQIPADLPVHHPVPDHDLLLRDGQLLCGRGGSQKPCIGGDGRMFDYKNAEKILEAEDVVVKFNLRGKTLHRHPRHFHGAL